MCHVYTSRYSFNSLSYEDRNVKKMHPQLTLTMHFMTYLIFPLFLFYNFKSEELIDFCSCKTSAVVIRSVSDPSGMTFHLLFSDNCLRFITKSLSLHVCFDSGTTFILLRDFPSYSSYNLSTEAVLLFNIPTAYLIIPSITTCLLL